MVTYENVIVEDEPEPVKVETPRVPLRGFDARRQKQKQQEMQEQKAEFKPQVERTRLTSYHEFLSTAFLSSYNINTKINQFDSIERKFDKSKSVFKDWKVDRTKAIQDGFLDEISYWNVPNFVKDEDEQKQIARFLTENCEFLKTYFII